MYQTASFFSVAVSYIKSVIYVDIFSCLLLVMSVTVATEDQPRLLYTQYSITGSSSFWGIPRHSQGNYDV